MTLGDFLSEYRHEHDLSQREFAQICSLSNGYISILEKGKNPNTGKAIIPTLPALQKLADGMNISLTEFIGKIDDIPVNIDSEEPDEDVQYFDNVYPISAKSFPMLGDIACGQPITVNEERELYVNAGTDVHADFCLRCKGDSMIGARIYDGDIVFIRKQEIVDNGEIAAVVINDEATLKRVSYFPEKNIIILKAENPKYEDLVYTGEQLDHIVILGKAVAFQSDIR